MDLDKLKKEEYMIEHTDALPLYFDIPAFCFTTVFHKEIPPYEYIAAYNLKTEMDWITRKKDIEKIGEIILSLDKENPEFFASLYKEWKKYFLEMEEYYQKMMEDNFGTASDKDLAKMLDGYEQYYKTKVRFPAFLDAFMFFADNRLHKMIGEFIAGVGEEENGSKIFSIISAPTAESFLVEAENDLVEMALLTKNGQDISGGIEAHRKKYSYINSSYAGYKEYAVALIKEKVADLVKQGKFAKNKQHIENRKEKENLFKKYQFSAEILQLVHLTELFVKWQDERKIFTLTHVALDSKFAEEISRRTKIGAEILRWCTYDELKNVLGKKMDAGLLKERMENPHLVVYKDGKVAIREGGAKAKTFIESIKFKQKEKITTFKGFTACLGKATGKARIIKKFEDTENLNGGEILVISMTRPEHTSSMKKAAAIVTDDGGITCHAAIIARELKKPCVIGTKIATQVLKDGDMVEVDADKGIIKIL